VGAPHKPSRNGMYASGDSFCQMCVNIMARRGNFLYSRSMFFSCNGIAPVVTIGVQLCDAAYPAGVLRYRKPAAPLFVLRARLRELKTPRAAEQAIQRH